VGRSSDPTGDKTDNVLVHSEQEVGGCHVKHNSVPAVAVLHGFLGGDMDHDVHSMINIQGLLVFAFAERT
jgi:hypothetical protein